jgi:predicted site-specific integrase-resolvase
MLILSEYAKRHGIQYRAAWNRFRRGKIPGAYKDEFGKVLIPETIPDRPEKTAIYARVSSSQNKSNLDSQAIRLTHYATAKGWGVDVVIKEVGSGLNDSRPKLLKLLRDPSYTRIVVEHKDRLTRFGFKFLEVLADERKLELIVVNQVEDDKQDLMQDFVSLVTSFCSRLYGLRRSKRNTEKLIQDLSNDS